METSESIIRKVLQVLQYEKEILQRLIIDPAVLKVLEKIIYKNTITDTYNNKLNVSS